MKAPDPLALALSRFSRFSCRVRAALPAGMARRAVLCAGGALVLVLVLGAADPGRPGETRIATIDLKKVFEGHFKTKQANGLLADEASGLLKARKEMIDDYQKAADEYKKALDEANNQALSADEREKRKKEAEGKLVKVNDLRQSLEEFEKKATSSLEEKQRNAKDKILAEIRNVVANRAKAAGFTMVLDSAAEGLSKTGVVLYDSGANDLTEAVLKEINANAPADLPTDDKKPTEAKPDDKKPVKKEK
jgi:Skp family chaperone for outer membrane proteins